MTTPVAVPIKPCPGCEQRLLQASGAIRHHESQMNTVMELAQTGRMTEEVKPDFKVMLVASFNEAQAAWDAYREHLIEHGILPERS